MAAIRMVTHENMQFHSHSSQAIKLDGSGSSLEHRVMNLWTYVC